jgi:F420H(2)-dependent quinone reductase
MYQTDGDRWVVVASNGGRARHPAWWLNLRSQPDASIQIGRQTYRVTATETSGADRERLWRKMADMYKGYDGYARKTTRQIPVIALHGR